MKHMLKGISTKLCACVWVILHPDNNIHDSLGFQISLTTVLDDCYRYSTVPESDGYGMEIKKRQNLPLSVQNALAELRDGRLGVPAP